ncbi:hypothetical protein ACWDUG_32190, partial [Streptomyces cellulosae]
MTSSDALAGLRPRLPSPLEEAVDARFERHGVRLLLKRDDLVHPELVGNKWRKLAPNLAAAAGRTVVTFGGAYSNHLRATAAAGRLLGLRTAGVVRGEELADRPPNPSLARCAADGMRLHFVARSVYRRKTDPDTLAEVLRAADAEDASFQIYLLGPIVLGLLVYSTGIMEFPKELGVVRGIVASEGAR